MEERDRSVSTFKPLPALNRDTSSSIRSKKGVVTHCKISLIMTREKPIDPPSMIPRALTSCLKKSRLTQARIHAQDLPRGLLFSFLAKERRILVTQF